MLVVTRWSHCSWSSPSGLVLLGGGGSPMTSELIGEDGSSTYFFNLEYDLQLVLDPPSTRPCRMSNCCYRGACSITTESSVVLTGGINSRARVSEFSESSYLRDLPQLQEGRWFHGCSYYDDSEGTKVITCLTHSSLPCGSDPAGDGR